MTDDRVDDSARKSHYGPRRQPWDDIVDAGWGPAFAAGNVLKYLRRDKDREHSIESARWYWARLKEAVVAGSSDAELVGLCNLLSQDELGALEGGGG